MDHFEKSRYIGQQHLREESCAAGIGYHQFFDGLAYKQDRLDSDWLCDNAHCSTHNAIAKTDCMKQMGIPFFRRRLSGWSEGWIREIFHSSGDTVLRDRGSSLASVDRQSGLS
ncbi:hypothetical protein K7432_009292 [Basidiobolus ranarum]|uniref:Uncharacterized protein n=1 Tax=Basidiobolus ranarum TaxID=34480 RepID=A0ABR2WQG4_9FUNG